MSDEGTAESCLVPKAGTEEGCREQDPSVLHLILAPSLLRRWVCGLCRGLECGCWPTLCLNADVSLECWAWAVSPGCAVTDKLWRGHHLILQLWSSREKGSASYC